MKKHGYTAKDIMRRQVVSIRPEAYVHELASLLDDRGISGVPVIDGRGELLGVVSKSDLVHHQREGELQPEQHAFYREGALPQGFHVEVPDRTRVKEIMTPAIISAEEETPVAALARMMRRRHIHRILVTRGRRLSGIVTAMDLLRLLEAGRR